MYQCWREDICVNYMHCCYLLTLSPISAGSSREYVKLSILEIIDCGMVFSPIKKCGRSDARCDLSDIVSCRLLIDDPGRVKKQ